ncbi:type II/IV secretion system ATPase subunit [Saccharolobus caldissimus]|uniref:Type II secretion protein VirB n=1 Tax=Saccharolobus caldissimus TaxID=1702097 RepID=A0AAQ4CMK0_9CREN|nr:type II/IV secretion system ATPase subunit [Saccharolobus caldissimus]BDB97031.1 type II secretion protein VirB [Saccharolobus caldissimus]
MNILEEYSVLDAKVVIYEENGIGYYKIEEPNLNRDEINLLNEILNYIYSLPAESNIDEILVKLLKNKGINEQDSIEKFTYHIKKKLGYEELTVPLSDPYVEEIECKGYSYPITVVHRIVTKFPRLYTNIIFKSEDEVIRVIEKLANKADKPVNIAKPYLEFSLPEGHRVAATVSREISLPGSTFDIRKFPLKPISPITLIKNGSASTLMLSYLWYLLDYKPFFLIIGATGSGKTTLLNALLGLINPFYKIVTIEDTPEINIIHDNWIRFFARQTISSQFEISLMDLAKLSLRYRPDYLVIGEVRGKEIEALVHASSSGHGSLATFHAGNPQEALTRLTSLLNKDITRLFLQNLWGIIVLSSLRDNSGNIKRIIRSIYELEYSRKGLKFKRLFRWSFSSNKFLPENLEYLVKKSFRLNYISKIYEKPISEIIEEIKRRIDILNYLLNENITDQEEINKYLKKLYIGDNIEIKNI